MYGRALLPAQTRAVGAFTIALLFASYRLNKIASYLMVPVSFGEREVMSHDAPCDYGHWAE
jgi:hypothetical protein